MHLSNPGLQETRKGRRGGLSITFEKEYHNEHNHAGHNRAKPEAVQEDERRAQWAAARRGAAREFGGVGAGGIGRADLGGPQGRDIRVDGPRVRPGMGAGRRAVVSKAR